MFINVLLLLAAHAIRVMACPPFTIWATNVSIAKIYYVPCRGFGCANHRVTKFD